MITKILTLLQQERHDYSLWAVVYHRNPALRTWVHNIVTRTRGRRRLFGLESTTLYPIDTGNSALVGLELNIVGTTDDLDAIWQSTQLSRPDSPNRHPFRDWDQVRQNTDPTLTQIQELALMLFGLSIEHVNNTPRVIDNCSMLPASQDMVTSFACFMFNVTYGFAHDVYFEPSYSDGDFWVGRMQQQNTASAVYGICHVAMSSPNRWRMVEQALNFIVEQVESEQWRTSLYSWLATSQAPAVPQALVTLAECIIIGSPILAHYYDVVDTAIVGMLPFETPEDYLEYSRGSMVTRRIETQGASAILRRATQAYPTPLTMGALPPIAVFAFDYDAQTRTITAQYHSYFELSTVQHKCMVVVDLRMMLKGDHMRIPIRNLPESFVIALLSLAVSADMNQNAIALTTEAVDVITTIWPNIAGHFAMRRLEATYGAKGHWWMKDRAPQVNEIGNMGWLFDNTGVCMAPRPLIGANLNVFTDAPAEFIVNGVRLAKITNSQAQITYRRV